MGIFKSLRVAGHTTGVYLSIQGEVGYPDYVRAHMGSWTQEIREAKRWRCGRRYGCGTWRG